MPRVADYVILSDAPVELKIGADIDKDFDFSLPANAHLGSRAILACILDPAKAEDLNVKLSINGKSVLDLELDTGVYRTVHEVIQTDILKAGANTATFKLVSGKGTLTVSDIVLWFQCDV
jgi:hypothetical protein